jgi:putative intracellular protease/amidase
MATVLMPIPARDFDPSEVALSWKVLTSHGHLVTFATPDGAPGVGDDIMLTGEGLDPWGFIPQLRRLRALGLVLRANSDARAAYREMAVADSFARPLHWDQTSDVSFDGLLLSGGHRARGMREYLESPVLQALVAGYFAAGKPVAAICHGVLLAARSRDDTGKSVLYDRKTTALMWRQESLASRLTRFARFWDPLYYRTYPEARGQARGLMSVEAEVKRALRDERQFLDVPKNDPDYFMKTTGLFRDSVDNARPAWVVCDRNYVSARWPGDAHTFARSFASVLAGAGQTSASNREDEPR